MEPSLPTPMMQGALLLLEELARQGRRIVTAESCTGGLLAGSLTQPAGASEFVAGGFVTYSNAMKMRLLDVPSILLDLRGAVSSEVAAAMADGAVAVAPDADVAISVTGIAGPSGGSAEKPVGLVWFAVAIKQRQTRTVSVVFSGNRDSIRQQAVIYAQTLVLDALHAG
ncbi:CinA family protein [Novacetimonas hansenii]|uniref:CinA family protein n=1 Tax=Novacetimonas hansenii TaxID=436 RepID=UPI000789BBAB|nr:CinA family protein [Novacetimonas hansenii]RFP03380.1 damage-inducible protein CinA [Novacetimonas hansenii]WEQ59317.1 CinA family protein [Novacetimonas hansenii]CUW47065.1 Nicotinamide-nucleotide amidohydrolase PncC [Novacetimonas hansenii]